MPCNDAMGSNIIRQARLRVCVEKRDEVIGVNGSADKHQGQ